MNNRKAKYPNAPEPENQNNPVNKEIENKEPNRSGIFTMIRKSGSSDRFILERKAADSAMYYGNVIRFIGSSVRQNRNLNFVNYSNFMPAKKIAENLEREVRKAGKSRGN